MSDDHRLIVRLEGDKDEILRKLKSLEGIKSVVADLEKESGVFEYEIEAMENVDLRRKISSAAQENGWPILLMKTTELTLEDIFLKITMGEGVDGLNKDDKGGNE